jgi:hypothetical protein
MVRSEQLVEAVAYKYIYTYICTVGLASTIGFLKLGCSVISVSFIICLLTVSLIPLAGYYFCVGINFVTPSFLYF